MEGTVSAWMDQKGCPSEELVIEKQLSFSVLTVRMRRVGTDCVITVQGGDRPHIGSVVMAVPRPSLDGSGAASATSSVLNLTGHKDEEICRYLAETAAKKLQAVIVCTGGFHIDQASEMQIQEVLQAVREIYI